MTVKPVFRYDMTIEEIGAAGNQYIESVWRTLYDTMLDELTIAFREIEDDGNPSFSSEIRHS
ncbi:DUF6022 family protein [Paenibacillus sp. MDMC362]|uniref:DUF6022 family protein n=1 Tax=Paenibacillus sp. MDMC362 TaxID=2977365 RepID=UPI0021A87BAC|nr:DUF6022 family protein [Paenibacillus sp. MDMC362]